MECYNTQAADRYAREEGEKEDKVIAMEAAMTELYSRIEKHIKADPCWWPLQKSTAMTSTTSSWQPPKNR